YRRPGQVGYEIKASLKPDAPSGASKHEIFLKTNDPTSSLVPVTIEANVQATLSVTPSTLRVVSVKVGEPVTRLVRVQGAKPFRLLGIDGLGGGLALGAEPPATPADLHTISLKLTPTQPGDFKRQLQIRTDLQTTPVTVTIEGSVNP